MQSRGKSGKSMMSSFSSPIHSCNVMHEGPFIQADEKLDLAHLNSVLNLMETHYCIIVLRHG